MSQHPIPLVDSTGVMTYVVGDAASHTIVGAYHYFSEADKGLKALQREGRNNLVLHNITHSKCPDWIMAIVKSDTAYCEGRALDFEKRAQSLRAQAKELLATAVGYDNTAKTWRTPK